MNKPLQSIIITGLFWSVIGRLAFLLVGFLGNVILARMLSPKEFGQIGIIMFFIAVGRVLTESGLGGALVRKKNVSDSDYSTAFYFNLVVSGILFVILFMIAPIVSNYYQMPQLRWLLVASSFILLIDAFQITYSTRMVRDLRYRRKSSYDLMSLTIASVAGILLAIAGAGVWAILSVQIVHSTMLLIIYYLFEPTIKRDQFSMESFKSMYKFGVNTTAASIMNTAFENVYELILAKHFSVGQTGIYFQAKRLEQVPSGLMKTTVVGVLYSAMAKVTNNADKFKRYHEKVNTLFVIATGLLCGAVFVYSEGMVLLVYGQEWVSASYFIKFLSAASFFHIQEMYNRNLFKLMDRTGVILQLEFIKKVIQTFTIIVGLFYMSMEILLYGIVITHIVSYSLNFYVSRRVVSELNLHDMLIFGKTLIALLMSICIAHFLIDWFDLSAQRAIYTLPIFAAIYLLLLQQINVFHPIKELTEVHKILKGRTN